MILCFGFFYPRRELHFGIGSRGSVFDFLGDRLFGVFEVYFRRSLEHCHFPSLWESFRGTIQAMSGTQTPNPLAFTLSGSTGGTGTLYRPSSAVDGSYATVAELFTYSLPENVQHDFLYSNLQSQLVRASREADTMICHRFNTPLSAYSEAWVGWVCDIAAYHAMDVRGWKPGDEGAAQEARFLRRWKNAMAQIKAAQDYLITPDKRLLMTESPQPATVLSAPNRGWVR